VSVLVCPACQRSFAEPGFCPFDGSALAPQVVAAPDQRTVLSAALAAQQPPTDVEMRRGTFPLTPTPPASAPTQVVNQARTQPAGGALRAVSAADDPSRAIGAMRGVRASEYDKLVGETLDGRYFVEQKIGEGGMGVVFSARHAVIERPLAIKVLKREVMRDTATIKRFVQEAKAASRIGHPNIVDVTDFGTTPDGMTYSVMEFVDGHTLGAALREAAPFAPPRALRITVQIARALAAAHDKGIVHRDLKPENVFLLDRDGRPDFVKIVDFGIAKVAPVDGAANEPRLTRAGSVFGTPEYMAPEQAAGRSDTDGRVDIYALGIILYEMLTGKVPHRGDSTVRTLAMQMLDPIMPPRQVRPDLAISPELEAVVMKALAKKREQRYATMGELIAALEALQTPVAVSVTGSPVYALAPLPPGADPALVGVPDRVSATTKTEFAQGPLTDAPPPSSRSKSPTNRRIKDEPEFVAGDRPPTFEHVFTEELAAARPRRWPIALLLVLILAGAGAAIALVIQSRARAVSSPARDAAAVVEHTPDATTVVVEVPADAGEALPIDALDIVVIDDRPDASTRVAVRTRDARPAIIETPNGRGTFAIQVLTKPEGATLYVGTSYRGPGGTNLEEPFGTRLEVVCKQTGYKPGRVQLVFDGNTEAALCVLERIKICIDGIKNPFDECEPAPP